MIEWKKYDPENKPKEEINYLVTNGKALPTIGHLFNDPSVGWQWWRLDGSLISNVVYYAEINLPDEETE